MHLANDQHTPRALPEVMVVGGGPAGLEAARTAALRGHADARGFRLSQEVADYLLRHAERDMPSLLALLDALDRYSLASRRAITVPLLRELLNA